MVENISPENDEEVERMLETWDIVRCQNCGREISMLDARIIYTGGGEYFVCREGCE